MTAVKWNIRAGAYYDSVVLMQLQRGLLELSGVVDAGVVMATQANRELLSANHLLPESMTANPDDLLIVVKADDENSATEAIGKVDELLTRRKSSANSQDFRPHSLSAAVKLLPEANWVLVSVPGRYAAGVAREALELDKHVFLYSDNVSIEDEISLKTMAREKGLLVMGPDCGTAIIDGVGLGFANRVRRGFIGVVGASGTGMQAVTSHIHELGGGISHAIGTGGLEHWQKVTAKAEAKFGKDKMAELFPDSAYQLTHYSLFPHDCIHVENLGGDIGRKELLNKRITLGVFPWKFKGGEAAFCRAVAWA